MFQIEVSPRTLTLPPNRPPIPTSGADGQTDQTLSLNSVSSNTGDMVADRVAGDFISAVDGTAGADTMNVGYTYAQGDRITTGNDFVLAGMARYDQCGRRSDLVYGGAGNDQIDDWNGNDTVYAGSGNDTVDPSTGTERLLSRGR